VTPRILVRCRWILLAGTVVTALATASLVSRPFGLGVLAAGLWALLSLSALAGLLQAAVVPPDRKRNLRSIFLWSLAKIGIYVVAIWALLVRPFPAVSLLVGLTWLPAALVIAGLSVSQRQDPDATPRGEDVP